MKVTILRGIPGAGKTTWAREHRAGCAIVSADDFFVGPDGYRFDPSKLPAAHGECLTRFVDALQGLARGSSTADGIVVDNTATTIAEVAPYAALALAYGADLEIITFACDSVIAARRNIHGVSRTQIEAMAARLAEGSRQMPPWWPHRIVSGEGS